MPHKIQKQTMNLLRFLALMQQNLFIDVVPGAGAGSMNPPFNGDFTALRKKGPFNCAVINVID